MRIFFNLPKKALIQTKPQIHNPNLEKELAEMVKNSEEAMKEITTESFNSETLKTIFMPNFKPKHPNCMMAVSIKEPNKPVEVSYKISQKRADENKDIVSIDIFTNDSAESNLGNKQYIMVKREDGKKEMQTYFMSSYEGACKKAGIKGIGIIEDILHIKDAIANGINRIPRCSQARATLFHIKMGFKPIQELKEINSISDIEQIIKKMTDNSSMDIAPQNYTPIIVAKENRYFLDKNTTQCIANIRQIKQNFERELCNNERPFIRGRVVEMELADENYNTWKQMIEKMFAEN